MKKNASTINNVLNAAFLTQSGVKSAKLTNKKMKNPDVTSFDTILNNKPFPKKSTSEIVSTASSVIHDLYMEKIAETPYVRDNYQKSEYEEKPKSVLPKAVAGTIIAAAILNAVKSKNALQPVKDLGASLKAFGYELPKIVLNKFRSGKIVHRGFSKAKGALGDKYKTKGKVNNSAKTEARDSEKNFARRFVKGVGLGSAIGLGNLGVHIAGDKYFENKRTPNTIKKSYNSIQEPVAEVYQQRMKEKRERAKTDKYRDNRVTNSSGYNSRRDNKTASQEIDNLFEKIAVPATFANKAHFFKTVLKEDVLQNSIKSIPYYALPAALGLAINRDLKNDLKPLSGKKSDGKIIVDIPIDQLRDKANISKKASTKEKVLYEAMPWKNFFKHEMPRSVVKSLTWAMPVAALTALTGRNLRGSGEKLDDKVDQVKPGNVRVTIESHKNKDRGFDFDPKIASCEIDELYKIAIVKELNQ